VKSAQDAASKKIIANTMFLGGRPTSKALSTCSMYLIT
jgi:hypothetical protein